MGEHDDTVRCARRRTTLLAVIGAVAGGAVGWFLGDTESPRALGLTVVGFAAAVGGLAGAFSLAVTTTRLSSLMSAPLDGLPPEARQRITRAVKSGVPLDDSAGRELRQRAYDHARGPAVYQPLALAQFLLLYVGIMGPQVPQLGSDTSGAVWSRLICSVLLITAAILTPLLLRHTRNARRHMWAASRADARQTLPSGLPPPHIE